MQTLLFTFESLEEVLTIENKSHWNHFILHSSVYPALVDWFWAKIDMIFHIQWLEFEWMRTSVLIETKRNFSLCIDFHQNHCWILTVLNKRYALLLLFVSVLDSLISVAGAVVEFELVEAVDAALAMFSLFSLLSLLSFSCFTFFLSSRNCSRKNRRMLSLRSMRSLYGESLTDLEYKTKNIEQNNGRQRDKKTEKWDFMRKKIEEKWKIKPKNGWFFVDCFRIGGNVQCQESIYRARTCFIAPCTPRKETQRDRERERELKGTKTKSFIRFPSAGIDFRWNPSISHCIP